jgi:predicted NBD/HSP70 family sugar kinase
MTLESPSANARYAIGLDIGGTKIAAGVVDLDSGAVLFALREPTEANLGGAHVLARSVRIANALKERASNFSFTAVGVGVGIAEMVDLEGNLTSSETIHWEELDPYAHLNSVLPTFIDSDARAGALAEARFGAGRGISSFLYVTIGTGISCSFVLHGKPWAGARGNGIVLANSPMTPFCHACGTRSEEPLELFAAGPGLIRRFRERGGKAEHGKGVLAAAEGGDVVAREVVTSAAEAVGIAVGNLVNALDPECVIVGGGLGTAPGLYWETFVSSLRSYVWAQGTKNLPILQATLGSDAGLIGAAALVTKD